MPHDINGRELKAGDIVTVRFRVKSVQANDEFCNCNLETLEPMFPGNHTTQLTVNTKQSEWAETPEAVPA